MAKKMSPEQLEKMRLGREAKKKVSEAVVFDAEAEMTKLGFENIATPLEPEVMEKLHEELDDEINLTESVLNNPKITLPELDSEIVSVIETMENMEEKLNEQITNNPDNMEDIVKTELDKMNGLEAELEKKIETIEEKIKPQQRMTYAKMFGSMWNGANW